MTFIISSDCVKCGMCVDVCPVSAIVEQEEQFFVTDACIDCAACVDVCPVDVISG